MSVLANFTIKIRLMVIAIVIALALLVLFVMTLSNASLLSDVGLTLSKVERLESGVLTLRRNEKDFLARKDLKYLGTFQTNVAKLGANHKYVEGRILEYGLDIPEIRNFERAYISYAEQFNALVEYQKKIGLHPKDGYYGDLRAAVHNVEEILKSQNSYKLLSDMLQLRRAEKDFMLRRDTKYLDKFEANLSVFNQHLDSESLDSSIKQSIRSGLERYNTQFKQLVDAEVKIGLDSKSGLLGDLRATIHQTDKSLAVMVTTLKEAMDERAAVSKLNAIIVFVLSTLVMAFIIYNVSQSILKPVMAVKNAVAYIRENNDLTWLVRSKGKDELVEMADDVNSLITDFRQLITNVNNALHTLDNATEELASNTQNTLDGMDKQFQESDMVATSGAEMQATVADINQNTQIATATANKTGELASAGSDEVNLTAKQITELSNDLKNALVQIEKLESDSQLIGTVSDSIRGIAEQTNLLALNAAIEAARAGEQGRGFAVVADEVRSLAMRTQESTSEIESIISSLQTSTQTIVGVVNQCYQNGIQCSEQAQLAGASLNQISEHVNEVVEMNSQISSSLAEQDEVATSMSAHVIQIRDIAEESQTRAATNAQASQDIAKQAAVLHAEIERYKTVR